MYHKNSDTVSRKEHNFFLRKFEMFEKKVISDGSLDDKLQFLKNLFNSRSVEVKPKK